MEKKKQLAAFFSLREGKAVNGRGEVWEPLSLARALEGNGADLLVIRDVSEGDKEHDLHIGILKEMLRNIDIPAAVGGRIKRLEDVKKYLYAGAGSVYLDAASEEQTALLKEASDRFGSGRVGVRLEDPGQMGAYASLGAGFFFLPAGRCPEEGTEKDCFLLTEQASCGELASMLSAPGVDGAVLTEEETGFLELKDKLEAMGLPMNVFVPALSWEELKKNENGLVPAIVQDYRTDEVLMMAYMNEQAFQDTMRTGRMHYYSRSRKTQWLKGETSGHFQYVRSLTADCDRDTLLARVSQIGAACHTGSRSCFFETIAEKGGEQQNPRKVLEDVYQVILDRKQHPKEGSYTNYLFDKGIDKILKKVGEEAAEIIIAAKNPDPQEIIYELSDFLYHAMVLMAEKGVTWDDVMEELAKR